MARIAIIGTGFVGSTVAYALLHRGAAQELCLVDADHERAVGEAMDLSHASPFVKPAVVRACALEQADGADIAVLCAGRNSVPGETRLDLLKDNAGRVKALCARLKKFKKPPILLLVSNPVDVLTEIACRELGWSEGRVMGSGTSLDTARLKTLLGARFSIDPHSIHGYVLGEHGDSEFVAWSTVAAGGLGIKAWPGYDERAMQGLFEEVRTAAYEIIKRKRATYFAIGAAVAVICEAILRGQNSVLPLSIPAGGRYAIDGVSLSLPCVVGRDGVSRVIEPELVPEEVTALRRSADVLRQALSCAG